MRKNNHKAPLPDKTSVEPHIRANIVAPGPIWTPLQVCGGQPQEAIPKFGMGTPLARCGQPVDLSSLYVYLASQESSYITAEVFGVTGLVHCA